MRQKKGTLYCFSQSFCALDKVSLIRVSCAKPVAIPPASTLDHFDRQQHT